MVMKDSPDTVLPTTAASIPDTLNRSLTLWNSLTIGFATVSPVAGLRNVSMSLGHLPLAFSVEPRLSTS